MRRRTARTRRCWRRRGGPPPSTKASTGQPITRDALRARLAVSNQAASELLRQLRVGEGQPPGTSRAA